MKISLLGPTNIERVTMASGKSLSEVEKIAENIGRTTAGVGAILRVVFNYSGMLKLIGDAHKRHGGKLEMLYTENDYDWDTDIYNKFLSEADTKVKYPSWHDMLLSLVRDSEIVLCSGFSAGVFTEFGYMKWDAQENKGSVKKVIGIQEFLRGGAMPPEIGDLEGKAVVVEAKKLKENLVI